MEPTQGEPPIRKRRRWLIVVLVFVLVSLCTWWYWPRGDARFVGKWAIPTRNLGVVVPNTFDIFTFRQDGTGTEVPAGTDIYGFKRVPREFVWRTGHGYFMMRTKGESTDPSMEFHEAILVSKLSGHRHGLLDHVSWIRTDEVEIGGTIYRRIPE